MPELLRQIESNRRNSYLLLIGMTILTAVALYAFSLILELGDSGFLIAGVLAIIYALFSYFLADKAVLALSGAKEVQKSEYPYLYNTIEGLSLAAGLPTPKMYVIDDPAPNAFATGMDPKKSSIAVTSGLLKTMNRAELEGVLAHEMSHIGNYDMRYATIAVIMLGLISILADFAMRYLFWGRGGRREGKGSGALMLIGLVLIILAPIFAQLVRFAISRKREYLADATGAKLTKNPEGLASALEKISKSTQRVASASEATAPLYFANPMGGKIMGLFSTHPQVEERIKNLRSM
jgi:heat shock protein HtpX